MITKEKNEKAAEGGATGCSETVHLEGVLGELGSFGRYQLLLLLLLTFRDSFLAMCNFNYVFTAADVPFRCVVPECEGLDSSFNASWSWFALQGGAVGAVQGAGACLRPAPVPRAGAPCSAAAFDHSRPIACSQRLYQEYNSLVAEFDLGCEPWKRTLVGTVHNLGLVFSFVFFGLISDRYGRKVVIVGSPLLVGSLGLAKSFAPSYWPLLVLEFLEAALGYGNASLVLSLESVSYKRRVAFSCCADLLASVGGALLGLIAWRVPHWRWLVRAIYAPLLAAVGYCWLVDEGVRWLVARGRKQEAARVLRKVARTNNVTLSARAAGWVAGIAGPGGERTQGARPTLCAGLGSVLRSRVMARRVALMAACFFCCQLLYYGAVVMAAAVSGDRYLNFSLMLLAGVPPRVVTAVTLSRFGRKGPIHVAFLLCALFFVSSAFVPISPWWWSRLLFALGMMCTSYGQFALYVVALEVFPTTARNSLTNLAFTLGRIGSVLAPSLPLLEWYMRSLPCLVFGAVALAAAVLALLLPDGSRRGLPDSVAAAERQELDQDPPLPDQGNP